MPDTNLTIMLSDSLPVLTSFSQFVLFTGIGLMLFGWMDKKEKLVWIGQASFIFLGCFALWVLLAGEASPKDLNAAVITKEIKTIVYFRGMVAFGLLNLLSVLLKYLKPRYLKFSQYLVLFIAILLFFMVVNIQKMAA